ncbi:TetR/AcrR family transcriptional regulator [Micromonospora sp. NPDC000089]|uniref:TetR/AcrR family transcriptional regulator n=1 Tax=unclassified Micromonospora TaxID=2617518 RepID=UPI0036BDE0BC
MTDAASNSGRRPPIWARPERGARGPAPAHSRDAIVAAAITLADSAGLDAVSMRAVAGALGTGAGSLYRYLSSRDDLLDLMADAAVGELAPYPDRGDDWLAGLLAIARRQLALYRRHPWLIDATQRSGAPGPHALGYFDACLAVLTPVECPVTAKFEAIAMLTGVVSLFARNEAASGSLSFDGVDLAAYPHLVAAFAAPGSPAPRRNLFERTLRGLLTGLLTAD